MNSYESLEALFKNDMQQDLNNEEFLQQQIKSLESEVMKINQNMGYLPTSREIEALPDLKFLADVTQSFREKQNFFDHNLKNLPQRREEIISALFGQVTRSFLKTKIYNDKSLIQTADQLFENLVIWCTRQLSQQNPSQLQILSTIIDFNVDYYKVNGKEDQAIFPFGFNESNANDQEHKKWVDSLKVGDRVDYLQYSHDKRFWVPAQIKQINDWSMKVLVDYELCESQIHKKYRELQPYQSKLQEYKWRQDLKVGDKIDYYSYGRNWRQCEILHINKFKEEDSDMVSLSIVDCDDSMCEKQTYKANLYSGYIAPAGKYSNQDSYEYDCADEVFLKNQTKKRYAILRKSNSPAQSIFFVKYINLFGEFGGFNYTLDVFSKKIQVDDFTLQCLMGIVRSSIENLVRPFVKEHGEILLNNLQNYLKQNSKENLRKIDKNNLRTILETINALVKRVYSKKEAPKICQKNEVDLALICLKSEFLEKQLFGSKILENLEKRVRNLDTEMDQKYLVEILSEQKIFQIIIKGHPSLIQKGHSIAKTMVSMNKVSKEELEILWKQILKTDTESRNALLNLLKQILSDFTQEQLLYFLDKMIESANSINDQELFDVLFQFKKIGWSRFNNYDIVQKVNEVLWEIIQSKQEMKKEYMKEVIKNFVSFVQEHENQQYIDKIIENICRNENQIRNIKLLKKLFNSESLNDHMLEKIKTSKLVKHMIDSIVSVVVSKKRNQEDQINLSSFTDQQKQLIEKQLSFIQKIFKQQIQSVRFSEVKKIWMLFKENNLEYNYMYQWLLSYLVKEPDEGFTQKYQNFFDQNVQCLREQNKNNLVSFFWILMIKMNINNKNLINHRVNLETNSLSNTYHKTKNYILLNKEISNFVGIDKLWEIYNTTENEKLEQKLCEHFAKLYSEPIPEIPCKKEIYQKEKQNLVQQCKQNIQLQDELKIRKSCKLIKFLILNEEMFGLGDLKSWNYFLEDSKLGLSYERENSYYYKDKTTMILIKKNKTLAQFKKKIADENSLDFRSVQLEQENVPNSKFSHLYNSLTLRELIDIENKHFILKEMELPEKEMAPILNSTKDSLTDKALAVFREIFEEYSTDGKMSRHQMAQFTMKATDGTYCSEEDDRIRFVFRKYSQENQDYITAENFQQFFFDSASHSDDKLNTVRYNLQSLGYDKTLTLKKHRNSNQYKQNLKFNIRYQLAQDNEFFKNLYSKMGENLNNSALDLVQFLTPNITLIQELIDEPISKLRQESSSLYWNYLCVILYQLLFKQKRMQKLLQNFGIDFNESQLKILFNKLYNTKFLELIIRKLQSFDQSKDEQMDYMYFAMKCLQGLFQIGIDFIRQDYIEDTINFIAYSMKLKRLKNKEKNKEKQNENNQANAGTQKEYGPSEKLDTKDKQKSNKNVNDLLKLKEILASSQANIEEFLKQIPFQKLNLFLIQLLQQIIDNENEYKFQNKNNLTKTLVIVLLSSLTLNAKNLKNLLSSEKGILKELLIKGLTCQKSIYRLSFKNFYTYLTSNLKDFEHKRAFLKVIMSSIKETKENDEMHVLIELASNILNEISEMKQNEEKTQLHQEFDFSKIFIEFTEKLYNYKSKETDLDSQEDNTLVAKLTFMEKIIQADDLVLQEMDENKKKELLEFMYKKCLFNIQNNKINFDEILCKSNKSRQQAHDLLTLIAISDIKLTIQILFLMRSLWDMLPEVQVQKQFQSKNGRKKQYGYTGLRNPGCICYMNAMLQQFYCIPTFRYGILMADDYKEEEPFQTQDMQIIDDNVFHQLQKMFAYLDFSQRQDFFPKEFCMSYKDSSKQRVNVLVQQDAYEFLNMIFDKMETSLKPTPFQGIIDSVFMGRNCCVFTCQGCGFKRQRLEINYNLSLEVKNIDNLEESFEKFIQKEVISDFMCDSCKKKEDVVKQTFLKELPNVMVIHLQKIIFDLEILTNIKISSRYEFPQNLNLQKFVYQEEKVKKDEDDQDDVQQDDPEDYEYKLVGVVIHRGNANFGHYISLINTNRKDPNRQENTKDEWLEFDDSKISVFNMNNFEDECFGSKIESDYHQGMYNIEGNVSQSAYILVYDKVKKSKVKFKFKDENRNEIDKLKNNLIDKENYKFENDVLETDFYNIDMYIPEKYKQEIEQDNVNQILENQLFSSNFTNTFASMLYQSNLPIISVDMPVPENLTDYQNALAKIIVKAVPRFFVRVYCVAYQNYKIKKIAQVLESALMIKPCMILNFLKDFFFANQIFLKYQLIHSMDSGIQYSINHLLTVSTTILIRQYDLQMQSQIFNDPQNNQEHATTMLTYIIDNFFLRQLKEFEQQKISRKTQYFFQSFKNICILNNTIRDYLLQSNQLNFLVELYQKQDTSNCRNAEYALSHLLHIIYLILQSVKDRMQDKTADNWNQLSDYFHYFARPQLLFKIMKEDYRFNRYSSLNLLTVLVCQDNLQNSFVVIKKCLKCLTTAGDIPSIPYLETLVTLLHLEDQFQDERIKAILGLPVLSEQYVKEKQKGYYIYGLSKESSLKRTVFKYLSPYGNEQSLVQGIFSHKDNNEVICLLYIHYVLVAAIQNQKVMNYLINLPPQNYVSGNLLSWVQNYTSYNVNNMQKSYNAPKSDLMYNYFQNLDQIVIDFEKGFKKTLQIQYNFTEQKSENFKYFLTTQQQELDTVKDNYMIGKTIAQNLVQKKTLYSYGEEELSISVHLIKVSLMKYRTNGYLNLEIPQKFLSHDSYLQKSELEGEFKKFIGNQNTIYYNFEDEDESKEELRPLGEDSDDDFNQNDQREKENELSNVQLQDDQIEDESSYLNKRYILRVSYNNSCRDYFSLQIKIENSNNENIEAEEWTVLAKSGKQDYLIMNSTLKNVSGNFNGLKISARFLENEERNLQSCEDLFQTSYEEIYNLQSKEE